MDKRDFKLSRRDLLKLAILTGGATLIGGRNAFGQQLRCLPQQPHDIHLGSGIGVGGEPFPTSPLILNPFTDPLPEPKAMAPTKLADVANWTDRSGVSAPPGRNNQDCYGSKHQIWPSDLGLPEPIYYKIDLRVAEHKITTQQVRPIDANGNDVLPPSPRPAGPQELPASTIYGFNGTFPGPMINAEYGRPVCVRFENWLDIDNGFNRNDFGAPDWAFLTHLHNGHTAPESDGNPNWMTRNDGGYIPGDWCDNMYLMWPPDNDPAEKQSFLWFHDHRMHHTGANVYKGMVGLMPFYDPGFDDGDETNKKGLRLPGRRTNDPVNGTFDVKYDIPMALYDCCLDDGVTRHQDWHNGCGELHPEWWGKTFYRHYPNHGFVGDIFTVNGTAYPVLKVKRRKYRFRFLGASIARIYNLMLMSSTGGPVAAVDTDRRNHPVDPFTGQNVQLQGQYQLPDGQQCMRMTQIASEGGLLPFPIVRDSCEIWPAKRREFIVDFTQYMDGSPVSKGDVVYLVNTLQMTNGRKPNRGPTTIDDNGTVVADPDFDPNFRVPILKIIIDGDPPEPDLSVMPRLNQRLRAMPKLPNNLKGLPQRRFELQRSGTITGETEWLINGREFEPTHQEARPTKGIPELWTVVNGGGGWVHPMHMHQEEHRTISRNGVPAPDGRHPDDTGKEDVVALDPGEEVVIYRNFRTFTGPYVAHCHNLAHEDHNMMFGWTIDP